MAQLLVLLSGGGVENGEYFQLALLILSIVSVIYIVAYVMVSKKRRKEAAAITEDVSGSDFTTPTNLPSH